MSGSPNLLRQMQGGRSVRAVAPDDDTTFRECRAFMPPEGGNVTVDFVDGGTNITLPNLSSGCVYPFAVTRIYATGTDSSGSFVLFD